MFDEFYEDLSFYEKEDKVETKNLDSLNLFMNDISKYNLLSADEEKALGKRIAKGDLSARNELVDANYRLVIKYAKKYAFTGIDLEDLIQAGCMGLIRAAEKFDYKLGYRFSTYATQWILQAIRRSIADTGRTIRVPVHMQESVAKQNKVVSLLTQQLGRKPTIEEIADETGYSADKVLDIFAITPETVSLDTPIGEDEDTDLYSIISDNEMEMPEEYAIKASMRGDLEKAFDILSEREIAVLKLRNGWDDGTICSLEYIAKQFNITRERVRQIEAKAYKKLRDSGATRSLREYVVA